MKNEKSKSGLCMTYIIYENSTVSFLSSILPKLVGKIIMSNFVLPLYWYFFIPYAMMFLILILILILLILEWLIKLMANCTCPDCMSERNIFTLLIQKMLRKIVKNCWFGWIFPAKIILERLGIHKPIF